MGNVSVETRRVGAAVEPRAPLGQSGEFETLRLPNPETKQEEALQTALATLLPRLDSDSFAEREAATLAIARDVRFRPEVERLLFRGEEDSLSLEVRDRLQRALTSMWTESPELQSLAAFETEFDGWNRVTLGKIPSNREKNQQVIDAISSSIERSAATDYVTSVTELQSLAARAAVCREEERYLRSCLDALHEAPSAPASVVPEQTLVLVGNELSRAVREGGSDPERLRLRVAALSACARRLGVEPTELGALSPDEASIVHREVAGIAGALRVVDQFDRAEQMGEGTTCEALAVCRDYKNLLIGPFCDAVAAGDSELALNLGSAIGALNRGIFAIQRGPGLAVPEKHLKGIAALYEKVLAGDIRGADTIARALRTGEPIR